MRTEKELRLSLVEAKSSLTESMRTSRRKLWMVGHSLIESDDNFLIIVLGGSGDEKSDKDTPADAMVIFSPLRDAVRRRRSSKHSFITLSAQTLRRILGMRSISNPFRKIFSNDLLF